MTSGVARRRPALIARRPALEADRGFLEDVHAAALGPVALVGYGWPEIQLRHHFRASIDLATCHVIVADEQRAGYVAISGRGGGWYIDAIAIARRYQGLGVGTAVLRDVMAEAGDRPVRLSVMHVNRARGLYARLGFRTVGRDSQRQIMEWRAAASGDPRR